jgi:alpha-tubulin suppressor-like RCC1 family protein
VRAGTIANAVDVATGADHTVALLANGDVADWGENGRGQLGLGNTADRTAPVVVAGVSGVGAIGVGRDQTLAITTTGQLWDWGFNDLGQLGDGTTANQLTPQSIPGLDDVTGAAGGRNYSVVLRG